MHPDKSTKRVIDGKRYSVATATLLASDEYWDGHNFERHGRNTFLYRTRGGAYFTVALTMWQGERDSLEAVSRERAMELYEELPEHELEYEEAFDVVVEEASSTSGRPTMFDEPMKQVAVWLPEIMIDWLKQKPGGMSETVRQLINQALAQS